MILKSEYSLLYSGERERGTVSRKIKILLFKKINTIIYYIYK